MKAVIFDLGRVLVEYNPATTVNALAALGNGDVEQVRALLHEIERPLYQGEVEAAELHRLLAERTGLQTNMEEFVNAFGAGLKRDEAALAYAVALQQRPGVTVGVISNTNQAHVYWLDENLPELDQLDLVIMSNEAGLAKPSAAIYELALAELEIAAAAAIFVDDLAENVAGARAIGMHALLHTDWAVTRPALEAWLGEGL